MSKKPKIAFVYLSDVRDIRVWSGIPYYMAKHLARVAELEYVCPLKPVPSIIHRMVWYAKKLGAPIAQPNTWSWITGKWYARQVATQIQSDTDIVFCPGHIPIADLHTSIPKIFHTDTTYGQMLGFYEGWDRDPRVVQDGHRMQRRALASCALAIYSSEWATNYAIRYYGASPSIVKTIPFGANIEDSPTREQAFNHKRDSVIRLLFVGKDWKRKGGDVALSIADELHNAGKSVELAICGSAPPPEVCPSSMVKVYPFLDKSRPADRETMNRLYLESDFLILPSRADCTPIVCCEAMAYGLPILSTNVGGLPSLVTESVNGFTFSLEAKPHCYAEKILSISNDEYHKLRQRARDMYEERFNWDVWSKEITDAMRGI